MSDAINIARNVYKEILKTDSVLRRKELGSLLTTKIQQIIYEIPDSVVKQVLIELLSRFWNQFTINTLVKNHMTFSLVKKALQNRLLLFNIICDLDDVDDSEFSGDILLLVQNENTDYNDIVISDSDSIADIWNYIRSFCEDNFDDANT